MLEEERFWLKVNKTETCWLWTGGKLPSGYGQFSVNSSSFKRHVLAHRYSYKLHNKNIDDSLCVLHKCDNPSCVNPEHLFLGTLQDNTKDMINKSRMVINTGKQCEYEGILYRSYRKCWENNATNVPYENFKARIYNGWTIKEALNIQLFCRRV